MELGVCYYPEHWPEARWAEDANAMRAMGLAWVRVGEFAWSRIEPAPGRFQWDWLDRAIDTLSSAGLKVVLCTPTATPPRWLVARHPDMLAVGEDGRRRGFGSRRHYCFSSPEYRAESERIVTALAERYGRHPAVGAWQTDNEYGCHDTVVSYSPAAERAFREWLADRYGTIDRLNEAWGTVFWSQEYASFDDVGLPVATVTEPNPAHRLAFRRFSSDQVVAFNRAQAEIIRHRGQGQPILHNSMGFFTDYDHYDLAQDLDAMAWDSYPLGFLDEGFFDEALKTRFMRTGHPDVAAFHHDLYRGVGQGRFWIMEQQPGPVNWASHNPAPLPGMVRLWTLEALAHGAEVVSYFRWRQAPFAQEQMHAGLLRPDTSPDVAAGEVEQVAAELASLGDLPAPAANVAVVFDYTAQWVFEIQPQGKPFDYRRLVFECYSALRQLGLNIDIVPPTAALDDYALVVVPSLPILDDALLKNLESVRGKVLLGPRTGSKTREFSIPDELAPGPLQRLLPLKVVRVESLRPAAGFAVQGEALNGTVHTWLEHIETDLPAELALPDGKGVLFSHGRFAYLGAWPDQSLLKALLARLASASGLETEALPDGVRQRTRGDLCFAFNYGPHAQPVPVADPRSIVIGESLMEPGQGAVWRRNG